MVRIRLRRVGAKRQPSYRIVAADKESPRDGRFIEILGFYNPRTDPSTIQLKEDRIYDWIDKGAQPSESAEKVFSKAPVLWIAMHATRKAKAWKHSWLNRKPPKKFATQILAPRNNPA
jgi:small subunit ribosomal protein S16